MKGTSPDITANRNCGTPKSPFAVPAFLLWVAFTCRSRIVAGSIIAAVFVCL